MIFASLASDIHPAMAVLMNSLNSGLTVPLAGQIASLSWTNAHSELGLVPLG